MSNKIAEHVADFPSRLTSNTKALYKYCPIPPIEYPQLKEELFCHYYYLRHLCDEVRFPNWEIREPVVFLRCCLAVWQEEIEKKPPTMSTEEACQILGLKEGDWQDASAVKRAYHKASLEYHPDRNPEGLEMFQKINFAYVFLSSTLVRNKSQNEPDVNRIAICLRTQSIIYR
jgi:DnaJ family protein C protein 13